MWYNYYVMMIKKLFTDDVTHALLLELLPFGTGYLETEERKPCMNSISAAMALQGIAIAMDPHKPHHEWVN